VSSGTFSCRIGNDGRLKLLPTVQNNYQSVQLTKRWVSSPYSLSITPNGKFAYISESLHDNHLATQWRNVVAQCRTRSDGHLASLSPGIINVESAGKSFVDSMGHFLYLLSEKTNDINLTASYCLAFAHIEPNGRLRKFAYQTLKIPAAQPPIQEFSLAFDHTGYFCYFAEGNYLYLFRRNANGSLSPLRPARINTGYGPLGIACVHR